MRTAVLSLLFVSSSLIGQTVADCKARFDKYLNLKGALNKSVVFDRTAIHLLNEQGKKEFTIYENEIPLFTRFLENYPVEEQVKLYAQKGTRRFSQGLTDTLRSGVDSIVAERQLAARNKITKYNKPLSGVRIAIDPGHFSSNIIDSRVEGKYLNFVNWTATNADTIKIVEGQLTFLTAQLLRSMLEEQGAKVILSRPGQNSTAFNVPYYYWFNKRRVAVLDSLRDIGEITPENHNNLMKLDKDKFFWSFFRDYELVARAKKLNAFGPDLTIIIHYNVDEKNAPWSKTSNKNFTMCFIGGAFVRSDLKKANNKLHFLRLLLTDQINKSEDLSHYAVDALSDHLKISKARPGDAEYLSEKGIKSAKDGVYCRNLILTRYINSPLVYGECLYQDNVNECNWLNSCNYVAYGQKVPQRVHQVAKAYFDGIMKYYNSGQLKLAESTPSSTGDVSISSQLPRK